MFVQSRRRTLLFFNILLERIHQRTDLFKRWHGNRKKPRQVFDRSLKRSSWCTSRRNRRVRFFWCTRRFVSVTRRSRRLLTRTQRETIYFLNISWEKPLNVRDIFKRYSHHPSHDDLVDKFLRPLRIRRCREATLFFGRSTRLDRCSSHSPVMIGDVQGSGLRGWSSVDQIVGIGAILEVRGG